MAEQLGLALAPLHEAGLAHGLVSRDQISCVGQACVLSLVGALRARVNGTPLPGPADEVATVCLLLGLTSASPRADGAALARWARDERQRLLDEEREQQRRDLLRRALDQAPPGISRTV